MFVKGKERNNNNDGILHTLLLGALSIAVLPSSRTGFQRERKRGL